MLRRIGIALALVCLLLASVPAYADQTPTERVKEGVQEIINILSNPEMTNPDNHEEAISALRETADKYISFRLATMYSVGKPWLKMSKDMQKQMVEAFTELLEHTYLRRLPSYGGEGVEYKKEIVAGKKAKVFTEITSKDKSYSVEFRLALLNGKWMLYDTVAEGVSLIANYRTQFSEVLATGSPEDLLKLLKERGEELKTQHQQDDKQQS